MTEIGMLHDVWVLVKIQLCWWHLWKAVCERLDKAKLSTMPYNPKRAWLEYHFIDLAFVPTGCTDPHEYECGLLDAPTAVTHLMEPPHSSPNTLSLRIPPPSQLLTFMVQEKKDTVKEDVSDDNTGRRGFAPLSIMNPSWR